LTVRDGKGSFGSRENARLARPRTSRRDQRPGAVVVALALLIFAAASVVHNHGLPVPGRGSPVFDGNRHLRESVGDSCVACRSSHEHVSLVVAPPMPAPAFAEPCRAVVPEAVPLRAPRRDAGGSRAPPALLRFSV
jgi:hypothetical protein